MRNFLVGLWILGIFGGNVTSGLGLPLTMAQEKNRAPDSQNTRRLITVAEASNYQETSSYADVMNYCENLAKTTPMVQLKTLGASTEGKKLPLLILADPPIYSAEEAKQSGKLIVFAMGNIHAGEIDGKEALLMLCRDMVLPANSYWRKNLIFIVAPIFNADGNDKMSRTNRPTQGGPEKVGIRANAQGYDLNRDFMKLESPEVRSLVHFFNEYDPAIVIDCHTTNGSFHRYLMTYEGGRCPAGDTKVIDYTREKMLVEVQKTLLQKCKIESYFYGSFDGERKHWETVLPQPRFGTHYVGLRNRIGILSESYMYAPYQERVRASKAMVESCLEFANANKDSIKQLIASTNVSANRSTKGNPRRFRQGGGKGGNKGSNRGNAKEGTSNLAEKTEKGSAKVEIPLRYRMAPYGKPSRIAGFVEEMKNGKKVPTKEFRDYPIQYMGGTETTLATEMPYAYIFSAEWKGVIENLQRHGIHVEELREDIELDTQVYQVTAIRNLNPFQKHEPREIDTIAQVSSMRWPAGSIIVKTEQPLAALLCQLLEPQANDSLASWNFFDRQLQVGKPFPVMRLAKSVPVITGGIRPLADYRVMNQKVTFSRLFDRFPPDFNGSPTSIRSWLPDGKHFLQFKNNQLYQVEATTGRAKLFIDRELWQKSIAKLPGIDPNQARNRGLDLSLGFNPAKTDILLRHEEDLYLIPMNGEAPKRLTKSPGQKELVTFSPNGKFLAFVRNNDLYAVDVSNLAVRRLTTDGSETIFNGKPDWVYGEEVFDRQPRAYWWSPDSTQLVFIRYDDSPVKKFLIMDNLHPTQKVESTRYPKAGMPNPHVKLGIVTVAGGEPIYPALTDYSETASLLLRAGWWPDSQTIYFYMQDRAQTWLDFCTVDRNGEKFHKLFRQTGPTWVEDPGDPHFLKDGSFIISSAHTGWNHLYLHSKDGKRKLALTSGSWEVTTGPFQSNPVELIDEENQWLYFTAKKESPIRSDLYRVHLDGTNLTHLTPAEGSHRVTLNPQGTLFVDSYSSYLSPTKVVLRRVPLVQNSSKKNGDNSSNDNIPAVSVSGSIERTLDTNPVYEREEYALGKFEKVKIPTPDGFEMEGTLLKPPGFDAKKKYPVWTMVYGGPHLPTIRDSWNGMQQLNDDMIAQLGFVVFHVDPRSGSGKGHQSTWKAYRQLGVQELKDLETAVDWLAKNEWVDAKRVGISGSSYGGYMTLFSLTHGKKFAAGIASAAVTDWHNYDSIYTERFMNTPQENPEGYQKTSIVRAAANLHGKLLIVHGLKDDNVHMQNIEQLLVALHQANKDFELMVYPRARHGGFNRRHYQKLSLDFMIKSLHPNIPDGVYPMSK